MKIKYPATILSRVTAATLTALLLVLSLLPMRVALAAPAAQDEATPLRLGEFGRATLTPDAPLLYAVNAPEDGKYTVTYSGDGDPSVITLNVTDSDGNEIYNDALPPKCRWNSAQGIIASVCKPQKRWRLSLWSSARSAP
jgi:hypothetical protein